MKSIALEKHFILEVGKDANQSYRKYFFSHPYQIVALSLFPSSWERHVSFLRLADETEQLFGFVFEGLGCSFALINIDAIGYFFGHEFLDIEQTVMFRG